MFKVLLIITFMVTYQVALTEGFLVECPVNREQSIGNVSVMSVLETFYKDLIFVQACTESRQERRYSDLVGEISEMATNPEWEITSAIRAYRMFSGLIKALQEDRFETADRLINENGGQYFIRDWVENYFYYFQAEVRRMTDDSEEAAKAALWSYLERKNSAGISMNQLERLDGLLALQKISLFNLGLDRLYGLEKGADLQLLRIVHFMFKDELAPLERISFAIFDRLFRESPEMIGSSAPLNTSTGAHAAEGVGPSLDDFTGQSVARATVESVLCEFAQKFDIIAEAEAPSIPDYSIVIDQLRRIDAELAQELEDRVVQYIDTDIDHVRKTVTDMWREYHSSPYRRENTKGIFLAYFHIELNFLLSEYGCNVWELDALRFANDLILHDLRRKNEGLSLDKMAELWAKIVLHWLKCFHERVKLAYELDGSENEQQLREKRSQLGDSCDRTLPDSIILRRNPLGH